MPLYRIVPRFPQGPIPGKGILGFRSAEFQTEECWNTRPSIAAGIGARATQTQGGLGGNGNWFLTSTSGDVTFARVFGDFDVCAEVLITDQNFTGQPGPITSACLVGLALKDPHQLPDVLPPVGRGIVSSTLNFAHVMVGHVSGAISRPTLNNPGQVGSTEVSIESKFTVNSASTFGREDHPTATVAGDEPRAAWLRIRRVGTLVTLAYQPIVGDVLTGPLPEFDAWVEFDSETIPSIRSDGAQLAWRMYSAAGTCDIGGTIFRIINTPGAPETP